MHLHLGRETTAVLDVALGREWLATNGRGGYAMGSVPGAITRTHHGLLVPALEPPLGRVVAVAGMVEEVVSPAGCRLWLHTQEWYGGSSVDPRGFELMVSFELDGTVPTWRWEVDGAILEKRLWMPTGQDTTMLVYTLVGGPGPVSLALRPLCTWRDHHSTSHSGPPPEVIVVRGGVRVTPPGGRAIHVRASAGSAAGGGDWYRGFHLRVEAERGLGSLQDLYAAGTLSASLEPGESLGLTLSLEPDADPSAWGEALAAERSRAEALVSAAGLPATAPGWASRLVLAADQFLVRRGGGWTVIAGYPWFGDWGRDTFISLPGLALATGRPEVAAGLLRTFAGFVDAGMIPNRFPDAGEQPEYNTVDATLWYVEALRAYVAATGDRALVDELWPVLEEIVAAHVAGTRHGIGVDPADGLLRSGSPGVQLTWMDAKVGDWVVTPRTGKAVEVNALWHNALLALTAWAPGRATVHDHAALAARVAASFDRFWDPIMGYCRDVVDGPQGDESAIRANAVIAASLHHTPLSPDRIAGVVRVAERELLTSMGLRTLARGAPGYQPRYLGDVVARDGAYHQGTVWPWLIGPLVRARLRAGASAAESLALLDGLADHLLAAGLGSISEIADAEPPHWPRGCPWQAWSVAEMLCAWRECATALTVQ